MERDLRFRKLMEHSYSGITFLDAGLQIVYRSPSAERITGWTTDRRVSAAAISTVHPDDQAAVNALLGEVLPVTGLSLTCTFRSMHYHGHYIWLENTYTNMLDEPGIHAIVCNFREITEQKETAFQLKKQTEQISELLETMTDGFIALDENLCYTYANQQVTKLLGRTAASLIGRHIWTLFPDAVGSATYEAIQTAFTERKYVCNEDFYAPLQLWQENRVYPSAGGVSVFIRDITRQKKEEHHLKLLESVITNTTDAIMITEAEPQDEPGPRILYVNEAFTKMTGYISGEIVGKSPRILQGPKTDKRELRRLGESLRKWKPCEVTVLNYKKNGEEFWINFTVNPVADEKGWYTHWISIDRDVTQRINEELQKNLLANITHVFNQPAPIDQLLHQLLGELVAYGGFMLAEVWLTDADHTTINLATKVADNNKGRLFYKATKAISSFKKGEGLPGKVWETHQTEFWDQLAGNENFLRREAAKMAGLTKAYGVPLLADNQFIGVLVLGLDGTSMPDSNLVKLFDTFSTHFGAAIKRKQLDMEKKELENLLNKVTDLARIGGWEIDLVRDSLYWSKITKEIHEVAPDFDPDLNSGTSFYETPKDRAFVARQINSATKKGTPLDFELPIITARGNQKWVRVIGEPEFSGKKCVRIYGSFQDVTDRKLTHRRLEESEKRYSDLFQLSPLPKWVFDLETLRFLDVNNAAIQHYGYTHEEFLNMTIKDIRPIDQVPKLVEILDAHQSQSQFIVPGIVTHQKKDGTLMLIEVQNSDMVYKSRAARIVIAHDMTDRINHIKAIESQNERLKEISWMQSHVIRAPLSRIMGLIDVLNLTAPDETENTKILEFIRLSAHELDSVIRAITDNANGAW